MVKWSFSSTISSLNASMGLTLSLNFQIVSQFRVSMQASSTTAVKGIEFARRTRSFLINTADRVIRIYKTNDVFNIQDGKWVCRMQIAHLTLSSTFVERMLITVLEVTSIILSCVRRKNLIQSPFSSFQFLNNVRDKIKINSHFTSSLISCHRLICTLQLFSETQNLIKSCKIWWTRQCGRNAASQAMENTFVQGLPDNTHSTFGKNRWEIWSKFCTAPKEKFCLMLS